MKRSNSLSIVLLGLCWILSFNGTAAIASPTFNSQPILSGLPLVGSTITVCVAATDPQHLPITIIYNYGDGTTDTLGKHIYTATGVYPITVTISNGSASATATLSITIKEIANFWVAAQTVGVAPPGKESWHAHYIYNADRTRGHIFNPATDIFVASLGTIPSIQIIGGVTSVQKFSGAEPILWCRTVRGNKPALSVSINESKQTIAFEALLENFSDKVPGIYHNSVQLGSNSFFVDEFFDARGRFTPTSGYRSTAFVISSASIKAGKAGKDSALFSLLLADPAFVFPSASGSKSVHFRVTNVLNQVVIDKELLNVSLTAGDIKSGRDAAANGATFSYNPMSGAMSLRLSKATIVGLLVTSEENVRVDVTIGDQTYSTHVTLFAPTVGAYSTAMPKRFSNFTPGRTVDTTAPSVISTIPVDLASNTSISLPLSATFSEAMNAATITTSTFTVQQGTNAISGAVSYSGNTATFAPTSVLTPSTTYIATISTGATDLTGNALVCNFAWSFTTAAAPDTTPPVVSSTIPANTTTGIAINSKLSAVFSEAMDSTTINSSTFTLQQGSTSIPGTVSYSSNNNTGIFTAATNLIANTTYTATITVGAKDVAGNALTATSNSTWSFTTAVSPDTTAPIVISTLPANSATGVVINSKLTATFSKSMDSLTITPSTFTLIQGIVAVSGTVTYSNASSTATFTPSANLIPNSLYNATVTTGAKDLAGNPISANFTWSFTTGATSDTTAPNVISTNPADQATNIAINHSVNATFDKAIDATTLNATSFLLAGPGSNPIAGSITYDATNKIATFASGSDLTSGTLFTATLTTSVKDLAGNALTTAKVWTFTTGTQRVIGPIVLGEAGHFGTFGGGAGMTNQGIFTVVNGDISTTGASTTVTGFHDSTGDIYTETPLNKGQVNGRIYTAPPTPGGAGVGGNASTFAIATQGASDANTAYNNMLPASKPGGMDPGAGQLGGLTLAPGIYKSAGATFQITGSDLTLDAQGDVNSVWLFQMAASLTVGSPGAPRSVILINGAQAKNVFWQVGSAATINAAGGGTMVGTIIASSGVTFSTVGNVTITTLNGRAIGLNASTTLVNTVINIPAP